MTPIAMRTLALVVVAAVAALALAAVSASAQKTDAAKKRDPKALQSPGLHHIAVKASDYDRSLRFYQEGIGLKRVYGWGQGDSRASLLDMGDGNYIELFAGGKPRPADAPEPVVLHFALRSADPVAAYNKAIAAGAKSQMEPKELNLPGEPPIKVHIAFVVGPDGEVIEFFKNDEL